MPAQSNPLIMMEAAAAIKLLSLPLQQVAYGTGPTGGVQKANPRLPRLLLRIESRSRGPRFHSVPLAVFDHRRRTARAGARGDLTSAGSGCFLTPWGFTLQSLRFSTGSRLVICICRLISGGVWDVNL